jgi:hypothetical protein
VEVARRNQESNAPYLHGPHDGLGRRLSRCRVRATAAQALEGTDAPEARILAATWRETLKEQTDGPAMVLRSMRARMPGIQTASRRKELQAAIGYIANQNDLGRMKYAEAIRRNYPIGTGITEEGGSFGMKPM